MVVNQLRRQGLHVGSVEDLMTSTDLRDFASKLTASDLNEAASPVAKSVPPLARPHSHALPSWLACTLQLGGILLCMTLLVAVPLQVGPPFIPVAPTPSPDPTPNPDRIPKVRQ